MTNRTSFAFFALALLFNAAQPAHAVLSASHVALPAAPADPAPEAKAVPHLLSPLIEESLRRVPVEHIPVGAFGEFGQTAGDAEIAPAAPLVAPGGGGLLDLKSNPEPEDASLPVSNLGTDAK